MTSLRIHPLHLGSITREKLLSPFLKDNDAFYDFGVLVTADKIYDFGKVKAYIRENEE